MKKKVILLITDFPGAASFVRKILYDDVFLVVQDFNSIKKSVSTFTNYFAIFLLHAGKAEICAPLVKHHFFSKYKCPVINLNKVSIRELLIISILIRKFRSLMYFTRKRMKLKSYLNITPQYLEYLQRLHKACNSEGIILLQGPSGCGKNFTAEVIHKNSLRKENPFIIQPLTDVSPSLIEAKLFGCMKHAYTGAENTTGILEDTKDGTLLLDEIAEISPELQTKLYGLLDTQTYSKLGSNVQKKFKGRLIFSTNENLEKLTKQGKFKKPLYYRIKVFVINIPALKYHMHSVGPLSQKFAKKRNKTLTEGAIQKLKEYDWPGNIRELKNVVETACDLCSTQKVDERYIMF